MEWDADECAAALIKPQYRKENTPSKKKDTPILNRFQALAIDGADDSQDDDDDNDTTVLSFQSKLIPSTVFS